MEGGVREGRRCLLSAAYTDTRVWEQRQHNPQNLAKLASLMDKTYEKKLPVSSLTISRFVDSISSREEVDQAEYYLYKFRHSPNCWYLRDWTIHSWFRQCVKYGARDRALYTLKNKVQFGMFPDEFTFNILIDSYLKDEDYKGACSVVDEVMLQEAFDRPTTQILSLFALSKYIATKLDFSWQEERNMGAAFLLAGLKQENDVGLNAQLLGHALIGKVEMARGIHAVFHNMPLMWTPGYLSKGLVVMEQVCNDAGDLKLCKEILDYMQMILQELVSMLASEATVQKDAENQAVTIDEDDELERAKLPQYSARFKELKEQLYSQGKVEMRSLNTLVSILAEEKLRTCEEQDMAQYEKTMQAWEAERIQLLQREAMIRKKAEQERLAKKTAQAIQ
ncbi:28S ribosomal protein S27, mitochondrial isoform X2 [Neoarius graeffei]|uniref:28S ribosomal protein S27, mitochondrial isoform X2 n=1 Tax=Neoarius graeffei TaxID=443677 RepID=UPI00298CCA02|nr:28S ribosomal protein S27, mitochondrial isoform X2 [Neoarius graeffei]